MARIEPNNTPDYMGRIWMHCEKGLSLSNASMARFMVHCLKNNIVVRDPMAFDPRFKNSLVLATVRIKPDQVEEFERVTKGKLTLPPVISVGM